MARFSDDDDPVERFQEEWSHFCDCINFEESFLDSRAVKFMNEIREYIEAIDSNES